MTNNPSNEPKRAEIKKRLIEAVDAPGSQTGRESIFERGQWPSRWVYPQDLVTEPCFLFFRREFTLEQALECRFHITADERYELFIDGRSRCEGPERGEPRHWYFDTYDLVLEPGVHTLVVRVAALGDASMRSQMSLRPGLILSPEGERAIALLGTGIESVQWTYTFSDAYSFSEPFKNEAYSVGWNCLHDGSRICPVNDGDEAEWRPVRIGPHGAHPTLSNRNPGTHLLYPSTLLERTNEPIENIRVLAVECIPADSDAGTIPYHKRRASAEVIDDWQRFLDTDDSIEISPYKEKTRVLIDLGRYSCADVILELLGGAAGRRISIDFAESLFEEPTGNAKGQRDVFDGKFFRGIGDAYLGHSQRERRFKSIHWRSGRFVQILIDAGDEALTISNLHFIHRVYPLDVRWTYDTDNECMKGLFPIALNTILASSHDSIMDGPYYEQMSWIGDCTQVSLVHYVAFDDQRLVRKVLQTFDVSRMKSGMIRARWPARDSLVIVPYACYWINVAHGYALWRDDLGFVKTLMPGMRHTVEAILAMRDAVGLIRVTQGWSFTDWVPDWDLGVAPGADGAVNACINWHFVYALEQLASLESHFGELELAARFHRIAKEIALSLCESLWVEEVGLFADSLEKTSFSEHGQIFAILSGLLPDPVFRKLNLFSDAITVKASISFSHFLLEAYLRMGRRDLLLDHLEPYAIFREKGFLTLPEQYEPARSDCHAWTAHPVFHYFASILGIRPVGFGFDRVEIRPALESPQKFGGSIPHPKGQISVTISSLENAKREVFVSLPDGLSGVLVLADQSYPISEGGMLRHEVCEDPLSTVVT